MIVPWCTQTHEKWSISQFIEYIYNTRARCLLYSTFYLDLRETNKFRYRLPKAYEYTTTSQHAQILSVENIAGTINFKDFYEHFIFISIFVLGCGNQRHVLAR